MRGKNYITLLSDHFVAHRRDKELPRTSEADQASANPRQQVPVGKVFLTQINIFFASFSVSILFFYRRQYSGSVTSSGSNLVNNYMEVPIIGSRQPRLVIYATATNILICPDTVQSVRNFAVDTKETGSTPQHTTLCDIPVDGGIHQKLRQNLCLYTEQLFKCSRVNHTTHSETVSITLTTKDAGITKPRTNNPRLKTLSHVSIFLKSYKFEIVTF